MSSPDPLSRSPAEALAAMRASAPLVQCITNYVAMNFAANVLLAAGAHRRQFASQPRQGRQRPANEHEPRDETQAHDAQERCTVS